MDVAVDMYLAILLFFTVLALILASVFMRLWGAEGERPREPPVAKPARESGPRDQEAGMERLPVEEVRVVKEVKEAAAEQQEEAAEELSPTAEPSPAVAEGIPRQPPTEPREPKLQEMQETTQYFPARQWRKIWTQTKRSWW
ncbi:matrix-remodeling-associated protein 7 [Amazona aestiva]|uniref:Matrix-remodeling-associated protein 7 n=1 Tax=Amazona aestiva TaxID=12930 RepID=A0A0Q3M725_AMAAE|nr:matrix-remodeling-associated protein 7 [Amazona aestiva]